MPPCSEADELEKAWTFLVSEFQKLGVMAHTHEPRIWEAEAERSALTVGSVYQVPDQPGLQKTLPQTNKKIILTNTSLQGRLRKERLVLLKETGYFHSSTI